MNDRLRAAFLRQGEACAMLGSPFMGRLMPLSADRLRPDCAVARRVLDWPGDFSSNGHSVPLRLAGALHGLVLGGHDAGLTAVYPPSEVSDDALWSAIETVMTRHEAQLMTSLDQAPQTNEVRRAGVDRNPLDPKDPAARLRLLAYLWPDQPHRLALTRGAIALAETVPDRDDAAPWLARRLASPHPGTLHVVYNTIA